ncbi:TIGR02594 family protein [Acinetobacter sp. UBA2581]|uniref:NlpC/P60 family protein n=1 Tax=Acinetobacter sp. UBA2581 TaxID=1945932 RepID=UPI00257B6EE2|nr:TIGR02594 family protein [Acinetobacter sp. UBA2581]
MKLIEQSAWKYLSVKLPILGAFLLLVVIPALQWAMDFKVIPVEYHAFITGSVMVFLSWLGKKIYQPKLHQPQLMGINSLLSSPQKTNDLAWMVEAKKHIGLRENTSKTKHNPTILKWLKSLGAWWSEDETAWCGTFIAHCLKTAGVKYPKHWYRALDYVNYGSKLFRPAYGCVAIKSRKGGGHVCFVVGRDSKTGKLVCLGGNQSNMVSYALYAESEFQEFRWFGMTNRPADHRYNLPIMSGVTATGVSES